MLRKEARDLIRDGFDHAGVVSGTRAAQFAARSVIEGRLSCYEVISKKRGSVVGFFLATILDDIERLFLVWFSGSYLKRRIPDEIMREVVYYIQSLAQQRRCEKIAFQGRAGWPRRLASLMGKEPYVRDYYSLRVFPAEIGGS